MTPSIATGLQAALLLARGRVDGVLHAPDDMAGARKSFWALAAALPIIIAIRWVAWFEGGVPAQAGRILTHDLLVYLVSWLAFAVVSCRIADRLGRGALWPRFIVVWNWCNVVGDLMILLGCVPGALGAPAFVGQVAQVIVMGWALWLEWVAIRLTLRAGPMLALYILLVDQIIGLSFALIGMPAIPR